MTDKSTGAIDAEFTGVDEATLAAHAICPNCGQPLANHTCPAVVIVSQAAGAVVTRAARVLTYQRGGIPPCGHCGWPHNSHDNARLIAFRCLWSQFSAEELKVGALYGAELTIENVVKFGRWWRANAGISYAGGPGGTARRAARGGTAGAQSVAAPTPPPRSLSPQPRPASTAPTTPPRTAETASATASAIIAEAVTANEVLEAAPDRAAIEAALRQMKKRRRS